MQNARGRLATASCRHCLLLLLLLPVLLLLLLLAASCRHRCCCCCYCYCYCCCYWLLARGRKARLHARPLGMPARYACMPPSWPACASPPPPRRACNRTCSPVHACMSAPPCVCVCALLPSWRARFSWHGCFVSVHLPIWPARRPPPPPPAGYASACACFSMHVHLHARARLFLLGAHVSWHGRLLVRAWRCARAFDLLVRI